MRLFNFLSFFHTYNINQQEREINPKKKDVIAWMVVIKYLQVIWWWLAASNTLFWSWWSHFLKRKVTRASPSWIQGSNLALANLLNASSFLQKASRNCHHLLFLARGNKSLSYQPNYAIQHKLYGKQCVTWSASFFRGWLIWIHTVCKEAWI